MYPDFWSSNLRFGYEFAYGLASKNILEKSSFYFTLLYNFVLVLQDIKFILFVYFDISSMEPISMGLTAMTNIFSQLSSPIKYIRIHLSLRSTYH